MHDTLELLARNCAQIISEQELAKKLGQGRPLRVKLGVDPTAPDIHLGHTVGLTKLRQFQELGHDAILIIGDFTAMIGDPSGRSATRPQLTHDAVMANAKTYQEQAFKILDPQRTKVTFNGEWFEMMTFEEVIRLNSRVTLQQMLQREDFRDRMDRSQPIHAHEIQYPLMQGWDSVMIRADIELGGTDQLFNIMVGRDLQREEQQEQQVAMMLPILEGVDGVQKMSKSLGNAIGVTDPAPSMFGKLMSIPDSVMPRYFELLLADSIPPEAHPMDAKKDLARRIVTKFHSAAEAQSALDDFNRRFSSRDLDAADLPDFAAPDEERQIVSLVVSAYARCFEIQKSRSDARRLVSQGSVQWQGNKIIDPNFVLPVGESGVLKLDKIRAVRLSA